MSCRVFLCESKDRQQGFCQKHYDENTKFGDPLYSVKKQLLVSANKETRLNSTLNPDNLKVLGLYTSYDVSKWAHERGLQSVYASRSRAQGFRTYGKNINVPFSVSLFDYIQPGVVIKKFLPSMERNVHELDTTVNLYIQANYDTPLTYLRSMKSLFPDMAVRLIQDDLVYLQKVWGSVATVDVSYEVPEQHAERVLSAYNKPKADFLEKKLELVS